MDYLGEKRRKEKEQIRRLKPPLAKNKNNSYTIISALRDKLENLDGETNNPSELVSRRSNTPMNNDSPKRQKNGSLISTSEKQTHLKILDEIKINLKKVLKDNLKQIELMNEDTSFYKECRDLINEVFEDTKPPEPPKPTHSKS